ncbi:MAG: sigma-70 family RNA polymerase sigma factor [Faecalimonas sp.]|nr:sigma-70 family RNA polymerase sigma factor [Faecalimonas sp.]
MRKIKKIHNHFEEEKSVLFEAINAFQNGEEDKATVIYKLSKQYCYSMVYHQVSKFIEQDILSGDTKAIVEDVMQELYMEFFKSISQFRNEEPNSFYKWIMVVSNRMVLRYVDKNKMEVLQREQRQEYGDEYDMKAFSDIAEDEEHNPEFIPDSALEKKEFQKLMKKFIKKLPEEQAETIIYHIYGGLKYQEIAGIMGVSLVTVKTRMRKAKDSLREMISDYEKKTGTRLRGVAPLPLIGFYLRVYMEHSKLPMSVDFKLFNQIRKTVGQSVSAIGRYIEALTEVNGVKEIVVGVVVATVVSTGTVEVVRHKAPEPTAIVQEQEDDTEQEKTEQEETKKEETNQEPPQYLVENHKYFIYWDNKTIDVSSYVHEGDIYEDSTYGKMKKWLVCEDALLQLPLTRKVVNGNNVYCYDDGTDKYEFVIKGTNSYTINGAPYNYEMEVKVIDGKNYINPYHLQKNMFGMTNFIVGGGSGGDFVAIKTTQYQAPTTNNSTTQSSGQNNQGPTDPTTAPENQSPGNVIMGNISNKIPPPGGYKNGDSHASSRFEGIANFLRNQKGGDSLVVNGTSLNYFDSIYVSYMNEDDSWMYLRIAKWITSAKITENLEDQVYMSLGSTLYLVMGSICGAGGDTGMQLYQMVSDLLWEYYYPENVPTQGVVEEDVPGLSVTLTQSPEGLEIRYFVE